MKANAYFSVFKLSVYNSRWFLDPRIPHLNSLCHGRENLSRKLSLKSRGAYATSLHLQNRQRVEEDFFKKSLWQFNEKAKLKIALQGHGRDVHLGFSTQVFGEVFTLALWFFSLFAM